MSSDAEVDVAVLLTLINSMTYAMPIVEGKKRAAFEDSYVYHCTSDNNSCYIPAP